MIHIKGGKIHEVLYFGREGKYTKCCVYEGEERKVRKILCLREGRGRVTKYCVCEVVGERKVHKMLCL